MANRKHSQEWVGNSASFSTNDYLHIIRDPDGTPDNKYIKMVGAKTAAPTTSNDGTEGYTVGSRWIDTTNDKEYVCLDSSTGAAVWTETTAGAAGGISDVVDDTTPQLGGQLDVNGNAIGDGTRELITFTEDASAVNHVNIENEATGSGPIIRAAGDDTNIDLNIVGKGSGNVKVGVYTFDGDQTVGAGQDNYVLTYDNATGIISLEASAGGGGGLNNVVEDTTPQLGGELDAQGNNIIDLGDVTFQTGASGGTLRTGTSASDKFILQAYDTNDTTYRNVIELDAGADVRLQMIADYLELEDATDTTKQAAIDLSGATTSTTTTLTFSQTANRVITFPDATDTLVGQSDTASTSASGIVELATAAETTTGTDATRAVTPDALAGSDFGKRVIQVVPFEWSTDVTTGDGAHYVTFGSELNGYNLTAVHAEVITAGTTGTTDIQIHNVTDAVDVLSTKLTIDTGETGSDTAATAAVINTANDDVDTNDVWRIDVDAVSTTAPKGLIVRMTFTLP